MSERSANSYTRSEGVRSLFNYVLQEEQRIFDFYWFLKTQLYYKWSFKDIGAGSRILRPLRINRPWNIRIGNDVIINSYTWLYTEDGKANSETDKLVIDDGCRIGNMNHITAVNEVYIGKKVLTADKVHISDNTHEYYDPKIAIMDQQVNSKGRVAIGDGTWIGENVSIVSCTIGRNCVIGANAVVINDVPDFCVAVGVPAKIVKRFNESAGLWERAR